MNTWSVMPEASWQVPQTMSLAGVAAKTSPPADGRSPGASASEIGARPDLAIEPIAFSTMFASPPFLFPGVGLALRSTPPARRYSSYHRISSTSRLPTAEFTQRAASCSTPSRTSVTSEKSTVAPAPTRRSDAYPAAGFAVMPEKASLPPHCIPTQRRERGSVVLRLPSSLRSFRSAISIRASVILTNPACSWSISTFPGRISSGSSSLSAVSFSHPSPTTMISPPKFGFRSMFRSVLMGTTASGASMATPQP